MSHVFVIAEVYSDASGRSFAWAVDIEKVPQQRLLLGIQWPYASARHSEGKEFRATISMIVQGKTLVCKIDNQVVKAVLQRK